MRYSILLLLAAMASAQPVPGTNPNPNFTTAGIGGKPELGSKFEVRASDAAPLTSNSAASQSLFVTKDQSKTSTFLATDYSTDTADGLNIYQGSSGAVVFYAGYGGVGPNGLDFLLDPSIGNFEVDANTFQVQISNSISSTMVTDLIFAGSGVSANNIVEWKAFPDPDGGSPGSTSQVEEFIEAVADANTGQAGAGTNYGTYSRGSVLHTGYRVGTNAIYGTSGTVFTSNGFTLFDYENAENIFVASTARAHTLVFPAPIFPIITATTVSGLGTCSTVGEGAIKPVTDSDTNTWGATVVHTSGALHVLAYCDGTNWTVMAK